MNKNMSTVQMLMKENSFLSVILFFPLTQVSIKALFSFLISRVDLYHTGWTTMETKYL